MKRRCWLTGFAVLCGSSAYAEAPKLTPWRLDARVYSAKSDRISKREKYDDRAVRMTFKLEVTNQEYKQKLENAKATLIAFAKHVTRSDELKVMLRHETTFSLDPLQKYAHETPVVSFEYDDEDSAQHGHKYLGYLLVIQNPKGEYLTVRSTPPMFGNEVEKVMALKVKDLVNRDLKKTGVSR
jgi:hypothetical protein